jgi:hypothetical protein
VASSGAVTRLAPLAPVLLTLLVCGCRELPLVRLTDGATATAAALDLGRVYAGASATRELTVENPGRTPQAVQVSAPAPFAVEPRSAALPPGGTLVLSVTYTPDAAGAHTATLTLTHGAGARLVSLRGEALAPLACATQAPCRTERFDPAAGACVATPLPDGTACASGCLAEGRCVAGSCLGTARSCDDGNACTDDACGGGTSCVHTPVTCAAPEDPCKAASCDPVRGCEVTDVPDGTLCGPPARCGGRHVCLAGACQRIEAPGRKCPPPPCTATGAGGEGVLQKAWTYTLASDRSRASGLTADSQGNLFWLESARDAPTELVSADRQGHIRFRRALAAVDRIEFNFLLMLTPEAVLVSDEVNLLAYAAEDGRLLWKVSPAELARSVSGRSELPWDAQADWSRWVLQADGVLAGWVTADWWQEGKGGLEQRSWRVQLRLSDGTPLAAAGYTDEWVVDGLADRNGGMFEASQGLGAPVTVNRWDPTLAVRWRSEARNGAPRDSSAVSDGLLVRSDGVLQAFETDTGRRRWMLGGRAGAVLLQDDRIVHRASGDGQRPVEVFSARTGQRLWRLDTVSRPVVLTESGAVLLSGAASSGCIPGPWASCHPPTVLSARSLEEGRVLWQCRTEGWSQGGVLVAGHWTGWEADAARNVEVLVSYAVPGWDVASTGWPQLGGGPEQQWRERGP